MGEREPDISRRFAHFWLLLALGGEGRDEGVARHQEQCLLQARAARPSPQPSLLTRREEREFLVGDPGQWPDAAGPNGPSTQPRQFLPGRIFRFPARYSLASSLARSAPPVFQPDFVQSG